MDHRTRLHEIENARGRAAARGHNAPTHSSSPNRHNFLQESLKRSIDVPAYISWQTLSTEVSTRLRQGSVRINRSNQVEWTSVEDGDEKSALLGQIADHKKASADPSAQSFRYSDPDINANIKAKVATSNWKVGVFLLVNAALGAGILNYPAAFDRLGGLVISISLQLFIITLLASTMLVLIFCAELHGDTTYHDVLRSMCGKRAQQMAASSIMCTCFGINVTFLVIIGDQYDRILYTFVGPEFCHETFYLHRNFTISATAILFIWPICYFKRLDFLRYVSTLGIFAMLYVVFLNIYEYYKLDVVPGIIRVEPQDFVSLLAALPVVCFSFQTHEIVLPIYTTMEKPRSQNFLKSTAMTLLLLFLIYTLAGTFGYLTFGAKVAADIIQAYDANDPVVVAGITAIVIKMITTYAPLMFCGRGALEGLYAEWFNLSAEQYIKGERSRRIVITTIWNLLVLVLAVVTPNITIAIEMLGSLAACNVFVFPGMCMVSLAWRHRNYFYAKYASDRRLLKSLEHSSLYRLVWNILLTYGVFIIAFGFVMFFIVIFQVVHDINAVNSEHFLCR